MAKLWVGESNQCWIDVWDAPNFEGLHVRLWGPADFPTLRIGEDNCSATIQSMRIGPGAYVQAFEDLNLENSIVWLLPRQQIPDVAKLRASDELDSIRLYDRPPFAREPGYAAYMLWAAHQIKSAKESQSSRANGIQ